jgi:hypothetical protein
MPRSDNPGPPSRPGTDNRNREKEPYDPGPEVPDPAPWVGQVGEGATLPSGEEISRTLREMTDGEDDEDDTQ